MLVVGGGCQAFESRRRISCSKQDLTRILLVYDLTEFGCGDPNESKANDFIAHLQQAVDSWNNPQTQAEAKTEIPEEHATPTNDNDGESELGFLRERIELIAHHASNSGYPCSSLRRIRENLREHYERRDCPICGHSGNGHKSDCALSEDQS